MNKFYCGPRHTLSIVYYIAASMGYSQEETKRVVGKIENDKEMNEFQKILTEPFYSMQNVEFNGETMDIIEPFNLAERIQMVIDLILKKTDLVPLIKDSVAARYRNSPFRFSNFVRNPKEEPVMKAEPKMTAREEYLRDEAEIEKFDEERLEELKQLDELVKQRVEEELQKRESLEKERQEERQKKFREEMMSGIFQRPFSQPRPTSSGPFKFKPVVGARNSEEIEEVNQAIESLIRLRNKLILNINEQNLNGQNKESQEPKEQPNINWDNVQKAQESPAAFEPVKFTEEQRQHQREILGDLFGSTSRYDQVANEKVRKLSEYSIRHSTQHLFDEALRNRTEEEAMISRSIEVYPSTNLCKDSLNTRNFKNPSDFKGLFSFVRVDGDRLYRINDSSVQPWNRSKPLGTIRMISENFGLFTSTKITIKVNEDAVEEYVDEYFDNPYVILDAVNSKYGYSITPEDISVDQVFGTPSLETPGQYLFRHSYYRVADEVKASLKESRNKLIKGLVRDSAIVVLNDKELYDWLNGKNPTNS